MMLLSTMSLTSNAASFTDIDDVQNPVAVDIITQIELMQGTGLNEFNPEGIVNRATMATICTTMLYGAGYSAGQYNDANIFSDVSGNDWFVNYVNVAHSLGIVSGRSATTFDPYGQVTTAEAMVMLLRTLGYFQGSGEFGDDWKLTVTREATKLGLYNDHDGNNLGLFADELLTRDDVAALAFNALTKTPEVSYNSTFGAYYTKGGSMTDEVNTTLDLAGVSTTWTATLADRVFFLDALASTDDFGRLSVAWKQGNIEFMNYALEADFVYTDKVTEKALYSTVGKTVADDFAWTVTRDGDYYSSFSLDSTVTTAFCDTKAGLETSVYIDRTDAKAGEVYVAQITSVLAEVMDITTNNGVNTITINYHTNHAANAGWQTTYETTANFAEGDIVVVRAADDAIQSVEHVDTVTGEVERYSAGNWATVDGTDYTYSYVNAGDLKAGGATDPEVGSEVIFYLDSNGYVLGYEKLVTASSYLYVSSTMDALSGCYAMAHFADGSKAEIKVDKLKNNGESYTAVPHDSADSSGAPANGALLFGIYAYSVSNDGVYTLTDISSGTLTGLTPEGSMHYFMKETGAALTIENGEPLVKANGGANAIAVDLSAADHSANYGAATSSESKPNHQVLTNTQTIFVDLVNGERYVGYANVPSMDATEAHILYGTNNVASVVYITARTLADSSSTSYMMYNGADYITVDGGYQIKVWIDGVETTQEFTKDFYYVNGTANDTALVKGDVYKIVSENSDGAITKVELVKELSLGYGNPDVADKVVTGPVFIAGIDDSANSIDAPFASQIVTAVDSDTITFASGETYTINSDTRIVLVNTQDNDANNRDGVKVTSVTARTTSSIAAFDLANATNNTGLDKASWVYVVETSSNGKVANVIYVVSPSEDV